jgi:hypothetical protein
LTAALDPKRTLREFRELKALTSDENGAQWAAFTAMWTKARAWLRKKLEELPVEIHRDAAGNVWATLAGESDQALLIGGHIDSVPNGGWLDGSLNLLAGLEILRRINTQYRGKPAGLRPSGRLGRRGRSPLRNEPLWIFRLLRSHRSRGGQVYKMEMACAINRRADEKRKRKVIASGNAEDQQFVEALVSSACGFIARPDCDYRLLNLSSLHSKLAVKAPSSPTRRR